MFASLFTTKGGLSSGNQFSYGKCAS